MGDRYDDVWKWSHEMLSDLRFPFEGAESITENYSQAWQDVFTLTALKGLRNGKYLEIGGQEPISNNNTYLLHRAFGWRGVSVELDPSHVPSWRQHRKDSNLVIADALTIDYENALPLWFGSHSKRVDYLQLDIDPSFNTLRVLKRLPLDEWRFSVVTFETDAYTLDRRARDESRAILSDHGYVLVAEDVSVLFSPISPEPIPFEDWWVDPQAVESTYVESLRQARQGSGLPQRLLFGART